MTGPGVIYCFTIISPRPGHCSLHTWPCPVSPSPALWPVSCHHQACSLAIQSLELDPPMPSLNLKCLKHRAQVNFQTFMCRKCSLAILLRKYVSWVMATWPQRTNNDHQFVCKTKENKSTKILNGATKMVCHAHWFPRWILYPANTEAPVKDTDVNFNLQTL